MTTLVVISAGMRRPSTTRILADELSAAVSARLPGPLTVTNVEVRDYAQAIIDALLGGFTHSDLDEAITAVEDADALIAVSPTFQGSYSGLFKSFIDLLPPNDLAHKPVLLGATGSSERHSLIIDHAMRPLFSYLRTMTVPTGVYLTTGTLGEENRGLRARINRAADELAAFVKLNAATRGPLPAAAGDESTTTAIELDQAHAELGLSPAGPGDGTLERMLRTLGRG